MEEELYRTDIIDIARKIHDPEHIKCIYNLALCLYRNDGAEPCEDDETHLTEQFRMRAISMLASVKDPKFIEFMYYMVRSFKEKWGV